MIVEPSWYAKLGPGWATWRQLEDVREVAYMIRFWTWLSMTMEVAKDA